MDNKRDVFNKVRYVQQESWVWLTPGLGMFNKRGVFYKRVRYG